ncbi:hypothetical protein F310043J5_15150 [Anaerostipes hominis (ex Lee et al. 2021)]
MALSRVWSLFQDENGYCFWSQAISDLPGEITPASNAARALYIL